MFEALLKGKRGLVVGIADDETAFGCDMAFKSAGADLTLTYGYDGAGKVVDPYNIMGPVKSVLEGTLRYLAAELGPRQIRVDAFSPGPVQTRAGSGMDHVDDLIDAARKRAPERSLEAIEDVGQMTTVLVSDLSQKVTGNIAFADGGYHVRA